MRTMNQQLATFFRCARRTLPWFIELIRASLEGHVKGQHAAAVSVQLDTDLQRRIQSPHGVMQHGGNEVSQCHADQYVGKVVIA